MDPSKTGDADLGSCWKGGTCAMAMAAGRTYGRQSFWFRPCRTKSSAVAGRRVMTAYGTLQLIKFKLRRHQRFDNPLGVRRRDQGASPDISRHVCTMIWFGARGVLVSCGRTVPWRRRTRERVGLVAGLRRQQIADKGSSVGLWVMPRV